MKKTNLLSIIPLSILCFGINTHISTFAFQQSDLQRFYGINEDDGIIVEGYTSEGNCRYMTYVSYSSYFDNLTENFGRNDTLSTCGYVSIGILLTYYDTVLNKNIVNDAYGVIGNNNSSFGCRYDEYFDQSQYNEPVSAYYNFLRTKLQNSLHAKLILKHKNAESSNPSTMELTCQDEFGTSLLDLSDIANLYFSEFYLSNSATILSATTADSNFDLDDLFDFVEGEIANGRPVILSYNGHWYVAYGYDENKISVHYGAVVSGHTTGYLMKFAFTTNNRVDAFSLNFNLTHNFHSVNYKDVDANNNPIEYCICGYNHPLNHSYNFSYAYYNSNYHKSYCGCGADTLSLHSYRINLHNTVCVCGGTLWD